MIQIARRLLLILLAAAVIAGGLYAFSTTSMAQALAPARGEGRAPASDMAADADRGFAADGEQRDFTGDGEDRGFAADGDRHRAHFERGRDATEGQREGFSFTRTLTDVVMHIGVIALVIAFIFGIRKVFAG